jgi:plastocyanin
LPDSFRLLFATQKTKNMKISSIITAVIGFVFAVRVASAGSITGTVTLNGTPPPEKEITPLKEDATCGKLVEGMPTTHFFVVGANKGLADVVVVVKGVPNAKSTGASSPPAELDQKGCQYLPSISAIQTGQKLIVKNSDPVLHNVHSLSAAGNTDYNLAQMAGAPDLTFTFDKPENFLKFKCDVHGWMFAWVTVVDHPYFAVTDKDGKFTIKNVPPGKYKVVAMHRKVAPTGVEKEVEVKDGDVTADFTMELK